MAARTGRGNTPPRAIRVSDELWEAAKNEAASRGETVTDAVVDFLRSYVEKATRN